MKFEFIYAILLPGDGVTMTMNSEFTDQATMNRPLCVDLDGTLIKTDMLYEAIVLLVRQNPFNLLLLVFWILRGKAYMKARIAEKVMPSADRLPYNKTVIDWLIEQKKRGRFLILATASHKYYAQAVAKHLGLFDHVEASCETTNLSSSRKADRLTTNYGEDGFDYVGNSKDDVKVWDKARTAFIVGKERAGQMYLHNDNAFQIVETEVNKPKWKIWLKAIRIHQWLKNSLLFVPAILASRYFEFSTIMSLVLAFISFGLCASSVYLLNDMVDVEVDRRHPTKRDRPLASGEIGILQAACVSLTMLFAGLALSLALPVLFTLVLVLYFITTCAYSFVLKRLLLIDVLTLAGLFTIRVIAGAAAVEGEVSTWLLAFCVFFFLSLALVKRFVEITTADAEVNRAKTGRGYQTVDLETLGQGGVASGFAAVVVLALFIDSPEVTESYKHPEMIWLVCPLVLYIVFRIWILARRKEMHDDPVVFLIKDWRSQIMIVAGAIIMLTSQMLSS